MCKKGDIILVDEYQDSGNTIGRHSFVVIDDRNGEVCGLAFDLICLVMSSFKDEQQRTKKLGYPGNFEVTPDNKDMEPWANDKAGYIKAEQFYYFDKSKMTYKIIGSLDPDFFNTLIDFIEHLPDIGVQITQIIDNLV